MICMVDNHNFIPRREFLKLSLLAFGSMATAAFNPFPIPKDDYEYASGNLGRITVSNKVVINKEPDWDSPIVGYLNAKDKLIHIFYEVTPPTGPAYNPLWYRVWGGFVHSSYIQKVNFKFNPVLPGLREGGQLCEVTVPYTQVIRYDAYQGWQRYYRLYYQTTHWVTGIEEGPDGNPWYRTNINRLDFLVPAEHFRPVQDEEYSPLATEVPWEEKKIVVSLKEQTITAYEGNNVVFFTQVSTGLPIRPDPDGIPWETPRGTFNIQNKLPTTYMGDGRLTGDPEAYELPGVPWTLFFEPVTGVAFHGAYWHNNFGIQMSHGCVNMRPSDALWLFRWTYPIFEVPVTSRSMWEKRGFGTTVWVE
jgi:lipoprotein-anchoring transpeptidase ErfK/SrfK